jgi:hypothetical protein
MEKSECFVGQKVLTTDRFNAPVNLPIGSLGVVIECLPEEAVLQFPGKRVRAFYSSFKQA